MHDALGDGADVHAADEVHGLFDLVLRDVVRPQAHGEERTKLLFQRQRLVARVRHKAPHDPGGADLHKIEVLLGQLRLIGAKDLVKLLCCLAEDIVRRFLLRVRLNIDLAQIFVQLRQRHLNGRLHGVDIDRRQLCARRAAGHGELIGEHELRQLGQYAVLGAENILKNTVGNRRLLHDLGDGGFFIALLKKQLDADRQDPFLGRPAGICACDEDRFPSVWHLSAHIVAKPRRKRKRRAV